LHPALTTVRVFTEEIGKHLAEAVLRRIENRCAEPQQFTIHTQLIKRESCRTLSETKELVPTEPSSAPILTPIH
jgi:DNA-binding LacI/PurR family transcriptional regulator